MSQAPPGYLPVVAAAIVGADGRLLMSLRHPHAHQGDLWEFPGGKLEAGESRRQALGRELAEELGIGVQRCRPLIQIPFTYPERRVWLDVWRVDRFSGRPRGLEGQSIDWFAPAELERLPMPPANRYILGALRLPPLLAITAPQPTGPGPLLARAERLLDGGVGAIQLRLPGRAEDEVLALARALAARCAARGALCFFNGDPARLEDSGAQGLHLPAWRLRRLQARPAPPGVAVSAACHDLADLRRAEALDLDCVLVSPVRATASHPERVPLGWAGFARLCRASRLPAYALGGLAARDLGEARYHGGQGVAAIRGLWFR